MNLISSFECHEQYFLLQFHLKSKLPGKLNDTANPAQHVKQHRAVIHWNSINAF